MLRSIIYSGAVIIILLFSFNDELLAIAKKNSYPEIGDTTSFVPNKASGWDILSSYLNRDTPDSVQFELILTRTGRIDGKTDQLIGTITNESFLPAKNQQIEYYLLSDDVWSIRITTKGECYLKQNRGAALKPSTLAGNPDVIPINIRYKR